MRIRKTASGITAAIMLATVVCYTRFDKIKLSNGGGAVFCRAEKIEKPKSQKKGKQ